MEQYVIKGGVPLSGEVEIGGAKNAALAILAAAIMTDETVTIDNLPDVRDINVLLDAIAGIGAKVERIDSHTVKINGSYIDCLCVDYDSMKKIRASYYLLGALLGKYKEAEVALPGGCNIGSRPMDLHIKGFKALGASVELRNGAVADHFEYSDKLTLSVVDLKHIELATDADKAYGIDKWAALFRSISWEEILMTAKNDEYLMEATKTLYNLNADDMVRQRCQARMDAELQEQYLLKKIDTLTTDNDKLTADNAAKDAEIEALKKELASLQQNV